MYNMSKGIKGIVDLLNAKGVEVTDENVAKVNAFVDELGTKDASEEDASVESVEEVSVGSEEVDSIFGSLPKYLPKTKITPFGVKDINEHIEAVGTVFDTIKETLKSKQEELKQESEERAKKANATKEDATEEDVEDDVEEATQVTEYVRVSHTSLKDGILTVNVYENNNGDEEEKEYTLGYNKETEQFEPLALGSDELDELDELEEPEELEELEDLDEPDEPEELEEPDEPDELEDLEEP